MANEDYLLLLSGIDLVRSKLSEDSFSAKLQIKEPFGTVQEAYQRLKTFSDLMFDKDIAVNLNLTSHIEEGAIMGPGTNVLLIKRNIAGMEGINLPSGLYLLVNKNFSISEFENLTGGKLPNKHRPGPLFDYFLIAKREDLLKSADAEIKLKRHHYDRNILPDKDKGKTP